MPLVLIHPAGLDSHCWDHVPLADAIHYDLPGHGLRPRIQKASMEAFAADVVHGVRGPLDLVGLSLGGAVALQIAVRYPRRVRSIVVACSAAFSIPEVALERAQAAERLGMSAVLDSTLERWFSPGALDDPHHPGVRYARARLLADDPTDFAADWRAMATHNVCDRLSLIEAPLTAIAADQDLSVPVDALTQIVAGVRYGRLEVLAGPHMLALESPEAFAAAVRGHLLRVTTLSGPLDSARRPARRDLG